MALEAYALTTLAKLNELIGTSYSADQRGDDLINAASEAIMQYCDREFARTVGKVEKLAGFDGNYLFLSLNPVESIASVTFDGLAVAASEYELDAKAGSLYRAAGWAWTVGGALSIEPYPLPGSEQKVIAVTYTGGYAMPPNRSPGTFKLPFALEQACLALCAYNYRMGGQNPAIASQQAGNASRSFSGGKAVTIPDYIAGQLEPFARIR